MLRIASDYYANNSHPEYATDMRADIQAIESSLETPIKEGGMYNPDTGYALLKHRI